MTELGGSPRAPHAAPQRLVVIGGGVSGLAAAHRALELRPELEVILLEGSDKVGGMLQTERTADGFVIERGPDAILAEKPAALSLATRVGLEPHIVRTESGASGAYVVHRGRLVRLPQGFSVVAPSDLGALLRSPILSPLGRARAALDLVLPRGPAVADESLQGFVDRRFGRELLERLAQPLAGGIYGADPAALGLRATMPRFLDMEASSGSVIRALVRRQKLRPSEAASGARYGMFFSFDRGQQCLPDAIAAKLGARVRLGARVERLVATRPGYHITLEGGETLETDALIVALPGPRAAAALASMDPELSALVGSVRYDSAATVTLAYRIADVPFPLDAYGFVVPAIERRAILASTWAHAKWPGRAPEGMALLRVFVGGYGRPEAPFLPDEDLIAAARRELRMLMGIEVEPSLLRVDRFIQAMPRYEVGHLDRVAAIEARAARFSGLGLAGGAYRGVGIPDTIASGERAAESLLAPLGA